MNSGPKKSTCEEYGYNLQHDESSVKFRLSTFVQKCLQVQFEAHGAYSDMARWSERRDLVDENPNPSDECGLDDRTKPIVVLPRVTQH